MQKSLIALSVTMTLVGQSQADSLVTSANQLERVVVTANRTAQQISDIAATVWVVEEQELTTQIKSGMDLKQALAQLVPSLDLASDSRSNFGQNMRGRAMMVMIDGVSLNSSRGISRHLDAIDPFNIQRIEVLSGATAVYGGGSNGGIINIITKQGDGSHQVKASLVSGFAGSDDLDYGLAASTSWQDKDLSARLSIASYSNQARYDGSGDAVMMDTTQSGSQYTDSLDLMASLNWRLAKGQQLDVLAQYYNNELDGEHGRYLGADSAGLFGDMSEVGIRKGFDSDNYPQTRRRLLNLSYTNTEFFGHHLNLQAFTRTEDFDFYPTPRVDVANQKITSFSSGIQSTDASGLKLVLSREWQSLKLSYGLDYDNESFNADQTVFDATIAQQSGGLTMRALYQVPRYPGFEVQGLSAFLQGQWQASERLALNAGLRHQRMDNQVDDFVGMGAASAILAGNATSADAISGGETDYDVNLVNLGAIYALGQSQQIWANYSQAFELPNVAKFYGQGKYQTVDEQGHLALVPGTTVTVGNSRLKGIKTDSVELGWRYAGDVLSAQLALYENQSDHKIVSNRATLLIDVVDETVRTRGVEGQLDYRLDERWNLGVSVHLLRSESDDAEKGWQRLAVTSASSSKLTSYLSWQQEQLSVRLQSSTMLRLKGESADKAQQIAGYTLVDVVTQLDSDWGQFGFAVRNLLGRDYSTQWGRRAVLFYAPNYGPEALHDHHGRGRHFAFTYGLSF